MGKFTKLLHTACFIFGCYEFITSPGLKTRLGNLKLAHLVVSLTAKVCEYHPLQFVISLSNTNKFTLSQSVAHLIWFVSKYFKVFLLIYMGPRSGKTWKWHPEYWQISFFWDLCNIFLQISSRVPRYKWGGSQNNRLGKRSLACLLN